MLERRKHRCANSDFPFINCAFHSRIVAFIDDDAHVSPHRSLSLSTLLWRPLTMEIALSPWDAWKKRYIHAAYASIQCIVILPHHRCSLCRIEDIIERLWCFIKFVTYVTRIRTSIMRHIGTAVVQGRSSKRKYCWRIAQYTCNRKYSWSTAFDHSLQKKVLNKWKSVQWNHKLVLQHHHSLPTVTRIQCTQQHLDVQIMTLTISVTFDIGKEFLTFQNSFLSLIMAAANW